ncbi:MAG: hypothetical protein LC749_05245 [Actinobacteria bacterium]|nr:hypothetical protein [Actinomycetota bacterium]
MERKPADVADPGEDLAGRQVPDPQLGQGAAVGRDGRGDLGGGRGDASVEPADLGDQVTGQTTPAPPAGKAPQRPVARHSDGHPQRGHRLQDAFTTAAVHDASYGSTAITTQADITSLRDTKPPQER